MNKLLLLLFTFLTFLIPDVILGNRIQDITVSDAEIKHYQALNDQEPRLLEYKDSPETLTLKLKQLALINQSRKKNNKTLLQLDILASRVANKMALQSVMQKTQGHFNSSGESPYHRYAFAEGRDHVMENASAISSTVVLPKKESDIMGYMKQSHDAFMAEKAPNDGHKQNVLNPYHNFVGIGFALINNEFRYYEEYLDRYLEFGSFERTVEAGTKITIPVKAVDGKHIYMAVAYYEKMPKHMSQTVANKISSYNDYTDEISQKILPWEMPQADENGYTPLEFTFNKKGLYYIHIYTDDKPYTKGNASTKNKIQSSGVVIQIQ